MKTKELQYFIGKICTVFTVPLNRNFKEENPGSYPEPIFVYFIGLVESITDQGITLQQVANVNSKKPLKTYYFLDKVIGIAEEEALDPNDETDKNIINTIKKRHDVEKNKAKEKAEKAQEKAEKMQSMMPNQDQQYLDPDALMQMAGQLKDNFPKNK